jgi:hypothetical protein
MFTDDPIYPQLIAYFAGGGDLYQNPNAAAFDALCITMTGEPAASLPSSGASQLVALYAQMQDRLENAQTYFADFQTWSNALLPTNPLYTVEYIEEQCIDCLLADFATTLATWQTLANADPSDATLLSDITTFINTQQSNLTNFQTLFAQVQNTLNAMGVAANGSGNQNSLLPQGLQSILSAMQQIGAGFGTIGKSPGQKYTDWLNSVGGDAVNGAGSGVNTSLDSTNTTSSSGTATA